MPLDNAAALQGFLNDLDRLLSIAGGVSMKPNIPDREALEVAMRDLMNARDMFILALTPTKVAH